MTRTASILLTCLLAGCTVEAAPVGAPPAAAATPASAPAAFAIGPAYLGGALPDGPALVPAPPAPGSAGERRDLEAIAAALSLAGSARFALAARDADLGPGAVARAFSCRAGVTQSDANTPAIAHLVRRAAADFGSSTSGVKALYQRPRPFMINGKATCTPEAEAGLRTNGSYPSGHSAIGYGTGLVLAAVFPDRAAALVQRGIAYGQSRAVCNVHWQSDVETGRTVAAATFARLLSDPAFREDLAKAQVEARTMIAADMSDTAACAAEAAALGTD